MECQTPAEYGLQHPPASHWRTEGGGGGDVNQREG
jgi:hypothetical protein